MSVILVGEAIQRLQSMYSKGLQSRDSRLTPRHIYSALKTGRSVVYRQRANSKQSFSQWVYQTLPCVELIQAPLHECPCAPNNGCSILRTKHKIPKPIQALDSELLQSVTTLDGGISIDPIAFESVKNVMGNKYTSGKPRRYLRNEYLYVTVFSQLKGITITGLFDDPYEASSFPSLCADSCPECACKSPFDSEFPVDSDLMDSILKIASQELIVYFKQMTEDKKANAVDDAATNGSMVHQPQSE